jgi:hypothetical protein
MLSDDLDHSHQDSLDDLHSDDDEDVKFTKTVLASRKQLLKDLKKDDDIYTRANKDKERGDSG